ncbi:MAG: SIS domain-containing protein [Bacteroidales bacterium]|nr:SIS domain-containing protein [Bacteroidales bacterium]
MEIRKQILESIKIREALLASEEVSTLLYKAVELIAGVYKNGGKVLFCGNGGSAADAQHLAAELSGRFYLNRPPLNAEALHVNTSFVTATANDHSFDHVYERMVMAQGKPGDLLMAFSTSGKSPNIIKAIEAANGLGMHTLGFTGAAGGDMIGKCTMLFRVPSNDTPRIQEAHMLLGHIICENVERQLFETS